MKRLLSCIACYIGICCTGLQAQDSALAIPNLPDSVTIIAVPQYKARGFKNWLLGSNYRKEWTQPLRVKVLDLGTEMGGLMPVERGGGRQSKSLRLQNASGKQFVLRSIEKYPGSVIPADLRETFIRDLVKDGISASYPFAPLSVPALAEAAGIPHANPQLVFVPDDPRLLQFRSEFANMFCLLEEREPGVSKSYSTPKVYEKLQDDHGNHVDQKAVLQARLLDMFIMDFDRHEDQWRWKVQEEGKDELYLPIPRDRDQAFFINNGFLPGFASRPWIAPQLQGFRKKAKNINTFNFTPRNFDRAFLNGLSEEDWKKQTAAFIELMTDTVIEKAIHAQPPEIFPLSGPSIINTLKERRQYLLAEALQYYHFLAKAVDIPGSDKKELFNITRNDDGTVQVTVFALKKSGDTAGVMYNRLFKPDETREIRVYGMGDEDHFVIHGSGSKTIKVRIIGGAGNDVVNNEAINAGTAKTVIYDLKTENNQFNGNSMAYRLSRKPSVNQLNRTAFRYNIAAPLVSANFNVDDGIFLGAAVKYTIHGFRKEPFSVQQKVTVLHSLANKAFNFKYSLEAIDVIGTVDLLLKANIKAPNNTTNFFGYGNESVFDKSGGNTVRHYRVRYNIADVALTPKINILPTLTFAAGPLLQRFTMQESDNGGKFISFPYLNGLDSVNLFKTKTYTGLQLNTRFDNRDSKIMPARGVLWQTTARFYKGLGSNTKNFTSLNTDVVVYFNLSKQANVILATRFGAGMNFGHYEFFQAQYLGGTENLRGFRKLRFAGDKMAFNNTELRIKLADFKTYLFPGTIGVVLFHDIGRVWLKTESSSTWHSGYGFGMWVAPLRRVVIAGSLGHSEDDTVVPVVSIGFQF